MLGMLAHLPIWLVIIVVFRDVVIVGAIILSWIVDKPVEIAPLYVSKLNTAGQIGLAALVLGDLGFAAGFEPVVEIAVPIVGALTIASAAAYLVQWTRHMGGRNAT